EKGSTGAGWSSIQSILRLRLGHSTVLGSFCDTWTRACSPPLRQGLSNLLRRLVDAAASDVNRYMRFMKGAAEIGEILLYLSKIGDLVTFRQTLLERTRIDIIERYPPENILRPIVKYDNDSIRSFVDNLPVAAH